MIDERQVEAAAIEISVWDGNDHTDEAARKKYRGVARAALEAADAVAREFSLKRGER